MEADHQQHKLKSKSHRERDDWKIIILCIYIFFLNKYYFQTGWSNTR